MGLALVDVLEDASAIAQVIAQAHVADDVDMDVPEGVQAVICM